jgi:hypothetical protein
LKSPDRNDWILRPASRDDLDGICEVLAAYSLAVHGAPSDTRRSIEMTWGQAGFQLGTDTHIAVTSRNRIAAYAEVRDLQQPHTRVGSFLRVHPEFRDLGFEEDLLLWIESRAREAIAKAPSNTRVAVTHGVPDVDAHIQGLLLNHGYDVIRHFWRMVADLDDDIPAPAWPDGVTIRTFVLEEDLVNIVHAARDAFQDHWGHVDIPFEQELNEWDYWIRNDEKFDPTLTFPRQLWVDYVRVYSRSNAPPSDVLLNPGFETGTLSPWVGYSLGDANALGGYVESTSSTYYNGGNPGGANVLTHSGQYATKVFGDFTGAENFNGFYQDVTAEPGSVWTAAGWALTHPQDLMVGDNTAWIEVSFRDAADAVLSLYRSQILTSANVTAGSWMNLEVTEELNPTTGAVIGSVVTMPAPGGAAKVRYQVVFRQQPGYDNGAMYFDDLSLVEQITILPFSLSASADGGNIQISFPTQNGVNYQMAYKSSVTNASWAPIGGTIVGDGSTNSISYPASSPAGFYRASTP